MTGADVKLKFEEAINEAYTDQWETFQLNRFFATATNLITGRLADVFQNNLADTHKILPLVQKVTITNPTNNIIDISHNSTATPNYYQVVYIDNIVFTVNGKAKPNIQPSRQVIYNQQSNIYSYGTYRYPKHELSDSSIRIQPYAVPITTLDMWYITEPIYIDTSDNVADIPYNNRMIEILVKQAMVEALTSIQDLTLASIEQKKVDEQL